MVGQLPKAQIARTILLFVGLCAAGQVTSAFGAELTRAAIEQKISHADGGALDLNESGFEPDSNYRV